MSAADLDHFPDVLSEAELHPLALAQGVALLDWEALRDGAEKVAELEGEGLRDAADECEADEEARALKDGTENVAKALAETHGDTVPDEVMQPLAEMETVPQLESVPLVEPHSEAVGETVLV